MHFRYLREYQQWRNMDGTFLCLIDHHFSVKFKEYIAIGSKFSHNYFNILKNPFIDLNKI